MAAIGHPHPPNVKEQMIMSWTGSDMDPRNPEVQILVPVEIHNLHNPIMLLGICRQEDAITYHPRTWNWVKLSTWSIDTTSDHHFQSSQPTTLPQPQAKDQIGHLFILKNINNYIGIRISGITQKNHPDWNNSFINSWYTLLLRLYQRRAKIFSKPHFFKLSTISNSLKTNFFPENLQTGI